jgi:hypothetical protein
MHGAFWATVMPDAPPVAEVARKCRAFCGALHQCPAMPYSQRCFKDAMMRSPHPFKDTGWIGSKQEQRSYRVDSNLTMVEPQTKTRQTRVQLRRQTHDLSRLKSLNAILESQKILSSQSSILTWSFECGVILKLKYTVEDEDEHKTYFSEHKTKFLEVYVKHYHLVDFIRLDPADILRLVGKTPLAVSA